MQLLNGCTTAQPDISRTCPVAREYTKEFEEQWGQEVASIPKGSAFRTVTDDYISLRDQSKDCWKVK